MTSWSHRRRTSKIRRNTVVLAVILAMIVALVPGGGTTLNPFRGTAQPGSGAVNVPDHPDGTAFSPNQLKDIKAADPGAGVNLIRPPSANNQGDARLGYTFELPPGRGGAVPQVGLTYNSAGANSWTGLGWDVPMQSITIDTRWGVPRYDGGLETETYTLNGEQLTPVAHRGELQARTAEKVFHTRIEGAFRKIVRHGDNPRGYWWEVIDKNGTRSFFGGDPATNGPAENSTLTDESGNIATWSLREVRDLNDNFVSYHCVRVADAGVAGGTVPGSTLYPQRITYSGHGDTEGRYSVTFIRDRDLGEPRRQDVVIDARNGFKQVTADLLRRVEVKLDDTLIRGYELNYRTGAFAKTLLRSVSQFGEDGKLFNSHSFDYYDDIRTTDGSYQAFSDAAGWSVPGDGLGASIPDGQASALSANTSSGAGGHLYVGFNPLVPRKTGSAGGKVGFSAGSSEGLLALTDVNGDGLPDKVFRTGAGVFYRPNLSGPSGQPKFGDTPIRLTNLPGISEESSTSATVGVESYFGVAAQLDHVSTTTRTDRYFSDVNGDGLNDLVDNGRVLFGFLDASGNPSYSQNSNDTPVPIGAGAVSGGIIGDQTAEFERQVDQFPLLDSVRRWVAPYDGTVRVTGAVRLVGDPGADRKADGVRVTIQHENTELWSQRIMPDDHAEHQPFGVDAIDVHRGDRLYFRAQSILDGRFDQTSWDPEVNYLNVSPGTDVNGLDNYRFRASRDFTLGGRPSIVTAPATGTLHLSGDVSKVAPTTDDVTVMITRNGQEVFSDTLPAASAGTVTIDRDIPVTANDTLSWRLKVDSPIDLGTVHWVPHAHYTAAEGVPVVDQNGNPTLTIDPPFDLDMYPVDALTAPQGSYTATQAGQLVVEPNLAFNFGSQAPNTRVVFTVKRRGELLAKRVIDIANGQVPTPDSLRLNVSVNQGDELFFDFSTVDTTLPALLTNQAVSVSTDDGASFTPVPSALHASAPQGAFAQPYRGWAAIGYQGNRARATTPIVQGDLALDENYRDRIPAAPRPEDVPGFDGRVTPPNAVVLAPKPAQGRWASDDDNTWVAADGAASARLGVDRIDVARDSDIAGATGVSRVGSTTQVSATFGAELPGIPIGAGASVARGRSNGEVDFLDLNGDRFPDVVGSAGIQYSDMVGGLGGTRGNLGAGNVRESDSTAFTASANAGSPARTTANGRGMATPPGDTSANTAKSGSELPGLGIGGSTGGGESNGAFDLIDINGDGLPDRVFDNGSAALNLGYRFAAPEPWPGGPLNQGNTRNQSINLGFNTDFYGFAGGVSASTGSSKSDASLMDVNGDGLVDRVFSSGGGLTVAINTGSGFTPPTPFSGSLSGINSDANASLGAGAYFTFGFCLGIFAGGCVVFNPGADVSTGIGRTEQMLRDVNGDGYADHVRSTRDNELIVAENRTGRTNLLRSVGRPLGARFDLDYSRDGNTADLPQSRWVLSSTKVFDGFAGDGEDTQLSTFRYENGRYDRLERQFNGYGRVTSEQRDAGASNALYRKVTNEFRTDSPYTRGLLTRSLTADAAGHAFLETLNTYALRDVGTGAPANAQSTSATVFPMLSRSEHRFYEGQASPGKSTFTQQDFDDLGNVTRIFDAADAGTGDDLETRTRYTSTDPACRARNIIAPNFVQVVSATTNTELRRRESTVDCVNGNVKQVRAFLSGGANAPTDLEYYDNGNLKSVIGPANGKGQRYRLDYGYDAVVGVHIESIVDSFGYRSASTHNLKYGLPDTTTDQNNQQVRTSYDTVGRVDTITGPYEIPENRVTIDFEYHPEAAVPYAVTRHVDRTVTGVRDDTIDTIQFIDGLKRVLQSKKDASVPPTPGATPQPVMAVSGRTLFDFAGRGVQQFYPVTEPKGDANTTFNPAFDTVAPTRISYDVLDRPTRTVIPDNTESLLSYGFGPDRAGTTQFETLTTDANGKQRRTYTDTRELTTSIKEFNPAGGQAVIWTSYGYNPMGEITSVVDDRNNTTVSGYDNFGRRTVLNSPDAGSTELRYDLADNLIAKVTPTLRTKNKAIEYGYEFTRLAGVRYPIFARNNVRYTYGGPGAPENGADRITAVYDAAGVVTRGYGPLGEVVRESRTIDDELDAVDSHDETFTTLTKFDAWNRVLRLSYPDGEQLSYGYDTGGLVNSATGVKGYNHYTYLARLDYDKFDQRVLMDTGNGVHTTYTYNDTDRRLATLKSRSAESGEFQNLSYGYDKAGNVTTLRNDVAIPEHEPIGGPSVQTFAYDDLYQLTTATGEFRNDDDKVDRYRLDLSYDSIHNTTAKNQRHELVDDHGHVQVRKDTSYLNYYTYTGGKPHAPNRVGPDDQRYDASGNLIDIVTEDDDLLGTNALAGPARPDVAKPDVAKPDIAVKPAALATAASPADPASPAEVQPTNLPDKRRQFVWDEENRLACTQDHERDDTVPQDPSTCDKPGKNPTVRFVYDDGGNRILKDGPGQKHLSPSPNFSETNGHSFKHIFVGESRLLTKEVEHEQQFEDDQTYFHADHLGSSSYVTDEDGELVAHQEFFASGETWVDESHGKAAPIPYQYNGKEFDEETGLYYYGARYYNPRTDLWQSADPELGSYLDGRSNGGVSQSANLALYTYASNSPVTLNDPDGRSTWNRVLGGARVVTGYGVATAGALIGVSTSWTIVGAVAGGAIFAWGADISAAGVRQVISGEHESTITSQLISKATGASQERVDQAEAIAEIGVTLGGSLMTRAPQIVGSTAGSRAGVPAAVAEAGALSQPGALRAAAIEVHELAKLEAKAGQRTIRFNMSTIALAEMQLPNGVRQIFASASAGRISDAQRALLVRLGVSEGNIIRGAGHAEENIINALPGATQLRWGIASASKNSPLPCRERCAPIVRGIIEGAE